MWLLSTDRAELKFFVSPEDVEGGYAILSHVWGKQEQSFSDVQKIREHCFRTGDNPRDFVSEKIRECCILGERHGYKWVWNDTCCIDKSSSAELSEAINSMFKYYSLAEVCYAYLQDVGIDTDLRGAGSVFRRSRWHQRGWTLQELIAPRFLIFLSNDWQIMGTKTELAELLEEITHIPARVLKLEKPIVDVSIAGRMSWAAQRETTRVEDEAYCLMGIFGINMPTLYGEGREAFRRLQEEIMKQSVDTSLFAWGSPTSLIPPYADHAHSHTNDSFLLAQSPSDFLVMEGDGVPYFTPPRGDWGATGGWTKMFIPDIKDIVTGKWTDKAAVRQVGIPTFSITPYGIHAHVPIFEVSGFTVAILFCSDGRQTLGLFLTRCPGAADPLRPLYHVGIPSGLRGSVTRMIALNDRVDLLHLWEHPIKLQWKEVHLIHRPSSGGDGVPVSNVIMNGWISSPFRFSEWNVRHLFKASGFKLMSPPAMPTSWNGSPPATFVFEYVWSNRIDHTAEPCGFVLRLGRCTAPPNSPDRPGLHWADLQFYFSTVPSPHDSSVHACPVDHVDGWSGHTRTFKVPWDILGVEESESLDSLLNFSHYDIALSFSSFPLNPLEVLVTNVSLRRMNKSENSLDIHLFEHSLARPQPQQAVQTSTAVVDSAVAVVANTFPGGGDQGGTRAGSVRGRFCCCQ